MSLESNPPASRNVKSRHISMRLPAELYERLESIAEGSGESISQSVRRLLTDALAAPDSNTIDDAIATLQLVRGYLAKASAETEVTPRASKTVNVLNAKTDLQHLIDDVGRGVEIIITHAGTHRARLVAVDDSAPSRPSPSRPSPGRNVNRSR
jgi:antitoxin (DNA-binding transcriptional repressor) of toxin-antitoxin stability system/predicted DNA-binding protein